MKKKTIKVLDLDVYSEKLDNGLEIYIIPDMNVNNTYATYSTRYGGLNNEFIPYNGDKMIKVPKGIAHFLEHKMFEQENDEDVFKFFSERGSDANANTNYFKTTYLFSGPNAFYDNLEFLINYVEKPYFTDENVEKEKGIIIEEIEMYEDKPFARMDETIMYNTFINHPMKYSVIGTKKSVSSITKEDLYTCYNTFYHPSNMFIVVTGNVDPIHTIEVIKSHENKRKIDKEKPIKLQTYIEPDTVEKEKEIIEMDVTIPKICIAYKISVKKFKDEKIQDLYRYIVNAAELKIGYTSLFNEKLRNEEIITESIDVSGIFTDSHIILNIVAESKEPEKVIELIIRELKNLCIPLEDFERIKKVGISDYIYLTDNIFRINSKIVNDLIFNKEVEYDPIGRIKSMDLEKINRIIGSIDLSNRTICIINPEKK